MNSSPLSPVVFSYATLQRKPLPTSPAEHCSAKLVPRPFCTLQANFRTAFKMFRVRVKNCRALNGLGTSLVLQCSAGLIGSGFPCKVA